MAHIVDTPANVLRTGNGVPSNALGDDGDLYLDLNTGREYQRVAGVYGQLLESVNANEIKNATNGQFIKGVGGVGAWSDIVAGDIKSATNGQFLKGAGGIGTWSPITNVDVGVPKWTVSTWVGGPPVSPAEGDFWTATAIGVAGQRWTFQYDSTEATYKWKYVGGAPIGVADTSGTIRTATVINTWQSVGLALSGLRNGYYFIRYGGVVANNTATTIYVGVGAAVGSVFIPYQYTSAIPGQSGVAGEIDGVTSNQLLTSGSLTMQVDMSIVNSGLGVLFPWFSAFPIKIS